MENACGGALATGGGADRGLKHDAIVDASGPVVLATGGGADRGLKQALAAVDAVLPALATGGGADRGLKPSRTPTSSTSTRLATGGGADRGLKPVAGSPDGCLRRACDRRRRRSRIETPRPTRPMSAGDPACDRRRRRSRIETVLPDGAALVLTLATGGGADRGLKPGVPPMYVGSRPLATGGGADRGLKLDVDADVGLGHHTCDRRRRRSRIETASTTSRPSTRRTCDRRRRRSRIETVWRGCRNLPLHLATGGGADRGLKQAWAADPP